MNKHAKLSRKLTLIGAIIYFLLAAYFIVIGMIAPIQININGHLTSAYLWEFSKYPGPLSLWVSFILAFIVFGVVGMVCRKKVVKKATTVQGVLLIIIGTLSLVFVAGIFYLISGIQTLLARGNDAEIPTSNG